MAEKQIKEGDLVVYRSRINCLKVIEAKYGEDGKLKSLHLTDGTRSTVHTWEDRASDWVIELPVSFEEILTEVLGIQEELQRYYECAYIDFSIEQEIDPFGKTRWVYSLSQRKDAEHWHYFLEWNTPEEEVESLARNMFDDAVHNFTLI